MNKLGAVHYGIAVHYEGVDVHTRGHSLCASQVRGIQRYHQETKGWADIGYSFLICQHGSIYVGRGTTAGAAAQGTDAGNMTYWAVCFLNGPHDVLTSVQKDSFADLRTYLMQRKCGRLVKPHAEFTSTLCPGRIISSWLRLQYPEV